MLPADFFVREVSEEGAKKKRKKKSFNTRGPTKEAFFNQEHNNQPINHSRLTLYKPELNLEKKR